MKHLKRLLLGLFCAVFAFSAVAFSACDQGTSENGPSNISNGGSGSEGGTEGSGSGTEGSGSGSGSTSGTEGSGSGSGSTSGSEGGDEGGSGSGGTQTPTGPFTVTIGDYDTEKGTVSVSAPKDGTAYALGELVTVTAEGKEGYESSAILVDGSVRERIASTYSFGVTKDVTVTATFADSTADLPEVTFGDSHIVTSFDPSFQGHWKSQNGTLFIGEKTLSYRGMAIDDNIVIPLYSEADQVYSFYVNNVNYQISWARTDYTVGFVLDVLNVSTLTREDFLPDPLPTENLTVAEKYYGEWTCYEGNGQTKLNISADGVVYNGKEIAEIVDGGKYERTNNDLQMVIGTNIYFFLQNNRLNILYWNGEEGSKCPVVDDCTDEHFFNNTPPVKAKLPQNLRGTWKSADGSKTLVVTEETLTIDGTEVDADSLGGVILAYQEGGKGKEAVLYAGSSYIMQVTVSTYGADGLLSGWTFEYYFKEGRPAVTVDKSLYGTWSWDPAAKGEGEEEEGGDTGSGGDSGDNVGTAPGLDPDTTTLSSTLTIGDTVKLTTLKKGASAPVTAEVHVIEAGETRQNGFVYFVEIGGDLYELFAENTAEEGEEPVWTIQLSSSDGLRKIYTRSTNA